MNAQATALVLKLVSVERWGWAVQDRERGQLCAFSNAGVEPRLAEAPTLGTAIAAQLEQTHDRSIQ